MQMELAFIPDPRPRRNLKAYVPLLPALIVLLGLVFLPGVWVAWSSLHGCDAFARSSEWVGLGNYTGLLTSPIFLRAVLNTLYFTAVFIPGTLVVSVVLAILLHRRPPGAVMFKTVLFASCAVSVVSAAVAWKTMYDPRHGLINGLLVLIGADPVDFLRRPWLALPAIAAMEVWRWFPVCTVVLMGGLRRIPRQVYDLAITDGATRWEIVRHVTVPMLRRPGMLCLVFLALVSLRTFEGVYVMTEDGGPATWSLTLPFLLYREGCLRFHLGTASALAVGMVFSIGLCAFLLFVTARRHFTSGRAGEVR